MAAALAATICGWTRIAWAEQGQCAADAASTRVQIETLNARFAYLIDHGRGTEAADLFVEEGIYETAPGIVLAGRPEIRTAYVRRTQRGERTSSHIFTNLHIRRISDDSRVVEATVILLLFAEDGAPPRAAIPLGIADYDDVYVCGNDGEWRYRSRRVTPLFEAAGGRRPVLTGPQR